MLIWLVIIVFLSVFQLVAIFFDIPQPDLFLSMMTVAILLVALGMAYRIHFLQKRGKRESLEEEIKRLKSELESKKNG